MLFNSLDLYSPRVKEEIVSRMCTCICMILFVASFLNYCYYRSAHEPKGNISQFELKYGPFVVHSYNAYFSTKEVKEVIISNLCICCYKGCIYGYNSFIECKNQTCTIIIYFKNSRCNFPNDNASLAKDPK